MARKQVTAEKTDLPKGVKATDTQYPKYNEKKPDRYIDELRFLYSDRFGWVVQTLSINARQNRSYGTPLSGEIVTCGNASSKIISVYVTESRQAHLKEWIDAKAKGMESAGNVRDRIGSRRAEGQVKRSQGLSSWMWSK